MNILLNRILNIVLNTIFNINIFFIIIATISLYLSFILNFSFINIVFSTVLTFISFFIIHKAKIVNLEKFHTLPAFLILTFSIIFALFFKTQSLNFDGVSYKTGGGGMYGDSALHLAYTNRINLGDFPPQNPLFAGKTLVYPYANDLLSAIFQVFFNNLELAFFLPQIIFFFAFVLLFYRLSQTVTDNLGFLFSILIFLFGWGIGFYYFLRETSFDKFNIFSNSYQDFTNNSLYNLNFHNLLTGLIMPERSFLPGLVLGIFFVLSLFNYLETKNNKFLIVSFFILGIMPFWHTHTFIFLCIFASTFFLFLIFKIHDLRKLILDLVIASIVGFIIFIPFLILFFSNHDASSFLRLATGWMNKNENLIFYWLKNSFFVLPISIFGIFTIRKKIIFIPAFISFLIANFIIFQPWDWDNIKILSLSFLFFSLIFGNVLSNLFRKNLLGKVSAILIVFLSILSGFLSVHLQSKNNYILYNNEDIRFAEWIKNNTGKNDVFLIEPIPNNPVNGLAGRLTYVGYPGHLWVHGIDYSQREYQANQVLAGHDELIGNLKPKITYLVIPARLFAIYETKTYTLVFENPKYRIYKLS